MRIRVKDVKNLIARNIQQARQMLRKLLVDRLEMTAFDENGQRGYRFTEQGSYGPLLSGEAVSLAVVAGKGFEPLTFGLCIPLQLSLPGRASSWSGLSLHPRAGLRRR
jgi:hypothetical protein